MPEHLASQPATILSNRATKWQLRDRTLDLRRGPLLMGIVNVTPDSFSDGGKFFDTEAAVAHGMHLVADGADILDIGGESTRPYSGPVDAAEESQRVVPVITELVERTDVPISVDTSKAEVAAAAVNAGAHIINDVTGLEGDLEMLQVARQSTAGLCVMHMRGTPQTMQDDPQYGDVVGEIESYLSARRDGLMSAGIPQNRICLDVGIGFGKTPQHNLKLMESIERFHALGCPILVGHSRKGFLGKILGDKTLDRTAVGIGVALAMAAAGVQVLRVHDVRPVREALLGFIAARA